MPVVFRDLFSDTSILTRSTSPGTGEGLENCLLNFFFSFLRFRIYLIRLSIDFREIKRIEPNHTLSNMCVNLEKRLNTTKIQDLYN
jgi:hypothetical protein